jgi:hypothetical protein
MTYHQRGKNIIFGKKGGDKYCFGPKYRSLGGGGGGLGWGIILCSSQFDLKAVCFHSHIEYFSCAKVKLICTCITFCIYNPFSYFPFFLPWVFFRVAVVIIFSTDPDPNFHELPLRIQILWIVLYEARKIS